MIPEKLSSGKSLKDPSSVKYRRRTKHAGFVDVSPSLTPDKTYKDCLELFGSLLNSLNKDLFDVTVKWDIDFYGEEPEAIKTFT